jgi:hypothetical protein
MTNVTKKSDSSIVPAKADVPPRFLIQTATPTGRRGSVVVLSYFALAKDFTSTQDRMIRGAGVGGT